MNFDFEPHSGSLWVSWNYIFAFLRLCICVFVRYERIAGHASYRKQYHRLNAKWKDKTACLWIHRLAVMYRYIVMNKLNLFNIIIEKRKKNSPAKVSIGLVNVLRQTAAAWTTVCISPRSRWRSSTEFWDESIIDLKSISGHMDSSCQINANGALFALDERQRRANYSQSTLRALSSTWKKKKIHCIAEDGCIVIFSSV